jgi:hypothetical protein
MLEEALAYVFHIDGRTLVGSDRRHDTLSVYDGKSFFVSVPLAQPGNMVCHIPLLDEEQLPR